MSCSLRGGIVHSEVAGWNTLDFCDITIVLIFLLKANLEELGRKSRATCK